MLISHLLTELASTLAATGKAWESLDATLEQSVLPNKGSPVLQGGATAQYNLSEALGFQYPDIPVSWNTRDVLLYAVSIGAQVANQSYVNELDANFSIFPTYPTVLPFKGTSEDWVDFTKRVFSGPFPGLPSLTNFFPVQDFQYIEPLGLLPNNSGIVPWLMKKRIIAVEEVVTSSGSNLYIQNEIFLYTPEGNKYARLVDSVKYLGGYANGVNFTASIASALTPKAIPCRHPDYQIPIAISPVETLIYRLNGDYNPLHVNPAVGIEYGYGGLILHALSYYSISAFQIVGHLGGGDPTSLKAFQGGFGLPVHPGDDLLLKIWYVGNGPDNTTEITYIVDDLTTGQTVIDRAAAYVLKK